MTFCAVWMASLKMIFVGSWLASSSSVFGQTISQNGFLGSYFNSTDFSGTAFVQVDPQINFLWNAGAPVPSVNPDGFSIQWTGTITPDLSEEYIFVIQSDGLVKLWIDDALVVDGSKSPNSSTQSGSAILSAETGNQLRLNYVHNTDHAFMRLFWRSDSQALEIVPEDAVVPNLGDFNFPPFVRLPPFQMTSPLSLELRLPGSVVDDDFSGLGQIGQDYGTVTWSQISGPGEVQYEDPSNPQTQATFPLMGEYVLNLEAVDEDGQASIAAITVIVDNPPWPMHHIDNASWNHNSLSPTDVNGDGFDDYAVMHEGPDLFTLIFHPGPDGDEKTIWPKTIVGKGGNPEYSAIADFDGDGNFDVVAVGGSDSGVKVFWGPDPASSMDGSAWTDSGVFPQTANQGHYLYVESHDVNADGLIDIVAGGRLQGNPQKWTGLFWLEAPQEVSGRRDPEAWDLHYIDPDLKSGHGFVFTDIDQDGDNDFVVGNADWNTPQSEEMVLWYENPGNGTIEQESNWPGHVIYHGDEFFAKPQVGVGDLNGDGLIDLCLQVRDEFFYFKKTGLNPVTWERIVIPKPAYTQWLNRPIKLFDINDDGKLDIVGMLIHEFGNMPEGLASVFWMEYTGEEPASDNWVTHIIKWSNANDTGKNYQGEKWDHLRFIDMDRDGDMDIVGNCEEHYVILSGRTRRTLIGVVWFENRLDEPGYAYAEGVDGLTVIEAENYTGMSDGDWFIHTDHKGYSGDGYLVEYHSEDGPAQDWNQSGGVTYEVNLKGGEYEVWVRRWAPLSWGRLGHAESNSVWLGINGKLIGESFFDDSLTRFNSWTWFNKSEDTVTLSEGRHLLNVQGREGGYAIDQIVIAQVGTRFNQDDINDWRRENFDDSYTDPNKETEWGWSRDPDGDGQINLWEMYHGTNPFVPNGPIAPFRILIDDSQQLSASFYEPGSSYPLYHARVLQNDAGVAHIYIRRPKFAGVDAVLEHSLDVTNWTPFFDIYATTQGEIIEEGIDYEIIRIDPAEEGLTDLNGSFFRMLVEVPDD